MKSIAQFTIDELIDYCLNIRHATEVYKKLPEINSIFYEKLQLVQDEEDREFYRNVLEDILLEIENKSHFVDNDTIKEEIINDYIINVSNINQKIEEKIQVEISLKNELKNIDSLLDDIKSYLADYERNIHVLNEWKNRVYIDLDREQMINMAFFGRDIEDTNFKKRHEFRVSTIGKFESLDYNNYNKLNCWYNHEFNIDIQRKCVEYWNKSSENINCEMITYFKAVTNFNSIPNILSYMKIDKNKKLPTFNILSKKNKWHNLVQNLKKITRTNYKEENSEVTWFELKLSNGLENFNYSSIYGNDKVSCENITWFKLASNLADDYCHLLAYYKIDIDGSITNKEIAYINLAEESNSKFIDLPICKVRNLEITTVFHYFSTNINSSLAKSNSFHLVEDKEIPVIIGYTNGEFPIIENYRFF